MVPALPEPSLWGEPCPAQGGGGEQGGAKGMGWQTGHGHPSRGANSMWRLLLAFGRGWDAGLPLGYLQGCHRLSPASARVLPSSWVSSPALGPPPATSRSIATSTAGQTHFSPSQTTREWEVALFASRWSHGCVCPLKYEVTHTNSQAFIRSSNFLLTARKLHLLRLQQHYRSRCEPQDDNIKVLGPSKSTHPRDSWVSRARLCSIPSLR